uniref:Reverse transcriptase zinc-binding domain-containing protein n=1 Tax=Cajanus cajan TaxID=3821 RepID=A0A151QLZ2_CAJCA|nr:hypothetical protein KK1_048470 [Cajanus cajan]
MDNKFKQIWKTRVPPKVQIFVWRLLHKGIPIVENLLKRNIVLGSQELLSIDCPAPLPHLIEQHFCFILVSLESKSEVEKWRVIWSATSWCIWRHRNACVYGEIFNLDKLNKEVLFFAWSWLNILHKSFNYTFSQWSINPEQCIQG